MCFISKPRAHRISDFPIFPHPPLDCWENLYWFYPPFIFYQHSQRENAFLYLFRFLFLKFFFNYLSCLLSRLSYQRFNGEACSIQYTWTAWSIKSVTINLCCGQGENGLNVLYMKCRMVLMRSEVIEQTALNVDSANAVHFSTRQVGSQSRHSPRGPHPLAECHPALPPFATPRVNLRLRRRFRFYRRKIYASIRLLL